MTENSLRDFLNWRAADVRVTWLCPLPNLKLDITMNPPKQKQKSPVEPQL